MLLNLTRSLGDESVTLCLSLAAMAFTSNQVKNGENEDSSNNKEIINTSQPD